MEQKDTLVADAPRRTPSPRRNGRVGTYKSRVPSVPPIEAAPGAATGDPVTGPVADTDLLAVAASAGVVVGSEPDEPEYGSDPRHVEQARVASRIGRTEWAATIVLLLAGAGCAATEGRWPYAKTAFSVLVAVAMSMLIAGGLVRAALSPRGGDDAV